MTVYGNGVSAYLITLVAMARCQWSRREARGAEWRCSLQYSNKSLFYHECQLPTSVIFAFLLQLIKWPYLDRARRRLQYKYDGGQSFIVWQLITFAEGIANYIITATIIKEDKLSLHFQTVDYSIVCLARDRADGFKVDWFLLPNEGFVTTNSPMCWIRQLKASITVI